MPKAHQSSIAAHIPALWEPREQNVMVWSFVQIRLLFKQFFIPQMETLPLWVSLCLWITILPVPALQPSPCVR